MVTLSLSYRLSGRSPAGNRRFEPNHLAAADEHGWYVTGVHHR